LLQLVSLQGKFAQHQVVASWLKKAISEPKKFPVCDVFHIAVYCFSASLKTKLKKVPGVAALPEPNNSFNWRRCMVQATYLSSDFLHNTSQFDVTRQVDLENPAFVQAAIEGIFDQRFGDAWPRETLALAITDVVRAYGGEYPGLLGCDTPYHDLRHTLDTTLAMARIIDGHEASSLRQGSPLGGELATVGVLLALFHDFGYLRRSGEEHLTGAQLVIGHEFRGAEFAAAFLSRTGLKQHVPLSGLIMATAFKENLNELFSAYHGAAVSLACMMASADVLSQLADRYYLERCRDFLFQEFVEGGLDRVVQSDGVECILYSSAEDLLRKTPWFFEAVIIKRLEYELRGVYRYLDDHFGAQNPYVNAMFANITFLKELVDSDDFARLRRNPQPFYRIAA
jgi:hypothetical protein